jgi:iron complex outermembrane recepter protein
MKTNIMTRILFASVCSVALTSAAFAQEATDDANSGEIVVTAQNREQNVNDVPIVIDVVGAEELKEAGFGSLNDIGKIAPVVQLNQDQGTVKVTVRGVGTTSNDEAQDTSVVINVDGEYINRPNILSTALFDMERVEVLRGPQGTLYGRNSTGGAINFITRKPGKDFGVDASGSYGNYNAIRLDGGVDLPLGGTAGVRLSGFYDKRDGYVYHPASPGANIAGVQVFPALAASRSDDNNSYGGRVSLRFDPSDQLSVNLAGEYSDRRYTPQAFAAADLNSGGRGPAGPGCNAPGFVRVAPAYAQTLCTPAGTNFLSQVDRGNYAAPNFGIGRVGQNTWAVRGRVAYEFSDAATLTYTGGYRSYSGDGDSFLTLPVVYRSYTFMDEARTQSHELRLNGTAGGITYQVGAFYFKETLDRESGFLLPSIATGFANRGGPGFFLSYFGRNVSSNSKSIFGQVEVPLGDTITAVGGLRYTDNKRRALYRNGSPFGAGPPDAFTVAPGTPLTDYLFNSGPSRKNFAKLPYVQTLNLNPPKEDKITWLAGLNYKPNSDTLVYAKASTGFKAGGFDSIGAYKPETNTAIEAGWKQSFGDSSQHQFNLGAFHYDYRDLQVSVLLDTRVGGQTFNAGKAKIWGLEAAADIALDDNTTFHASFNYLNAEFKDLRAQFNVFTVPGTGTDVNGVGDLDPVTPGVQQPNFAGNRPPFSPTFIVTAGLDHVFQLGSGTLTASADTTFKSKYFTDFYNYRDGTQSALTQTDLSLTFKPESKRFSVQAFVKNLENTRALTYGSFTSAGPDDIFNWQFGTPRTYGIRVGIDF